MHARNARRPRTRSAQQGLRLSRFGLEADAAGDLGQGLVHISVFVKRFLQKLRNLGMGVWRRNAGLPA